MLSGYAPGSIGNAVVASALLVLVSALALFVFLLSAYYLLTNVRLTLPRGAAGRHPRRRRCSRRRSRCCRSSCAFSSEILALQALGATSLLLVWLYVMANVIVFGAEVNW